MRAEKTSYWRIEGQLEISGVIHPQGREYTLLEVAPYITKSGRAAKLLTWEGTCTVCGEEFTFQSGKARFHPTATCEHHRPVRRTK
jgi:hypothetical protein